MTWEEFIRQALIYRITDDTRYTQERLGYIPTDEEVADAVDANVNAAVCHLVEALDSYEADVWWDLEREEEKV